MGSSACSAWSRCWAAPSPSRKNRTSGTTNVAIVSYSLWKRLLGGDPHVIGTTIRLTDSPFRIVGVMPPGFEQLSGGYRLPRGEAVDVWLPFNMLGNPQGVPRAFHYCHTVARLKPGVTIEAGAGGDERHRGGLEAQYPDDANWRIQLKPLHDDLVGQARPTLLILAGAVGFVLLIACVNVANLLLARAAVREREMAIRTAVGATRARLVRQMLTESVTLAALGGALGLLLAWWGVRALVALGPNNAAPPGHRPRSPRGPGHRRRFAPVGSALRDWRPPWPAYGPPPQPPRGVFVVAEVALSFVLLIGAGLLLRSFVAIGRVDPGFNPRGVLTMNTALSFPKLVGARRYAAFYERFVEEPGATARRLRRGRRVESALDRRQRQRLFGIEGRPGPPA